MCSIAKELEERGFIVTSRWLESTAALSHGDLENGTAATFADMDFEDLRRADVCIAFTEPTDSSTRGRGGRHAELGIAIGLGLTVLLVGPPEHVFHALPSLYRAKDWEAARRLIRTGALTPEESGRRQAAA
jgi:nucleoside 2-deoxyribosyltransferase